MAKSGSARPRGEDAAEHAARDAAEDLYVTLGVARDATDEQIRKAYRKLARENHPDVNPGDAAAEDRFKRMSFANDVLSDPEKRKRYDEFGLDGLAEGFDPSRARSYQRWSQGAQRSPGGGFGHAFDLEDLFGDLLGGRRGRGPGFGRGPERGSDVQADIDVDFLDAVRGDEVRIQLPGRGTLRVRIPGGATDGTRVRLSGQGEPSGSGGSAGDLYLVLRIRPHPHFRRSGDDLELDLPVTVPEALLGASISVPTPYGPVTMKIPPRSQNGQRLRLKSKGATRRSSAKRGSAERGSEEKGDLFVRLAVELPTADDPKLDELARELEPLYEGRDPRKGLDS